MKVLFCGKHFSGGFIHTKNAIERRLGQRGLPLLTVETITCDREDVPTHLPTTTVLVPLMTPITAAMLDAKASPKLKLVMQYGVGLEGVNIPAASQRRLPVCKIPSADCGNAPSCAEHAIFLAIALLRDTHAMKTSLQTGGLGVPLGRTLFGGTATIVGYGGIGRELLPRLLVMGVKQVTVIVRDSASIEAHRVHIADSRVQFMTLPEDDNSQDAATRVIPSDVIFLCCNQHAGNIGFVNSSFLRNFSSSNGQGVIIVNIARGGLLNYDDMAEALRDGRVSGLGLDVYHTEPFPLPENDPLLSHSKVVVTPHIAGVTDISYRNMAEIVADNVMRILDGVEPTGIVNKTEIR